MDGSLPAAAKPLADAPARRAKRFQGPQEWFAFYQRTAIKRGGECLSEAYRSAHEKMRWRCGDGHHWEAEPNSIKQGRWCPACATRDRPQRRKAALFVRVKRIARRRGGACVSMDYVNSQTHLRWRCAEGHEWEAVPSSIIQGSWCARCLGRAELTLDDMRALGRERGGECVAAAYYGNRVAIRWRCAEGHEWRARPYNVRSGKWCPYCSHRVKRTLIEICAAATALGGECLSLRTSPHGAKGRYRFRCRLGHVFVACGTTILVGRFCMRCKGAPRNDLARMHQLAQKQDGECLSAEYFGSIVPLLWRCREGHEWLAPPNRIVQGRWCATCRRTGGTGYRLTIAELEATAATRGGRCLTTVYDPSLKVRWQCASGHQWLARAVQVRFGSWCPSCARRIRGTIDGMRAFAAARGAQCLSAEYNGHATDLEWRCAAGHRFRASGKAVKSGVWCPTCGRLEPRQIESSPGAAS